MAFVADLDMVLDPRDTLRALALLQLRLSAAGLESYMQNTVVPWLQVRTAQRFADEGDDAVGRWTPLRQATERFRAAQGFPPAHPINIRTHQMHNFLTSADGNTSGGAGYASLNWPGSAGRLKAIDQKIRTAQGQTPGTVARPVIGLSLTDDIFISARFLVYLLS